MYCYSHAHLLDLKNDKSDIKKDDLAFMETLVGDNYLSHHALEKRTSCYLAKPLEAFADIEQDDMPISFSNLFDFDLSFATEEQKLQLEDAKDILFNQKLDFGFSQIQNFASRYCRTIKQYLNFLL